MRFVLNTVIAKKTAFGGFRVTCSFFRATLKDNSIDWFYLISQDVADVLCDEIPKDYYGRRLFVFPNQPNLKTYFQTKKEINRILGEIKPDIVYSIVAPSYFTFEFPEVMRCANAWTVVGGINKYVLRVTPFSIKIRRLIHARITQRQMRKAKYFVTQSELAKKCILRTVHTAEDNVCVVSNVLPELYIKHGNEKSPHDGYNMVYASSPAYHKDFLLLPQVASILINEYEMKDFKIHITIPNHAIIYTPFYDNVRKYGVEDYFVNHGIVKQDELADLYSICDIGLFPSLLETFSATLIEYMYFKLPIVASDLEFNKEVAENAALYFKPHDAKSFAEKIFRLFSDQNQRDLLLKNADERLALYSNTMGKYEETVSFLKKVASLRKN